MKKLFIVSASFLVLLALAVPVFAQKEKQENFKQGELVTLPAGETINRDFFAFGERVEISGTVNGDVYAAGGMVIVDGKINGDLLVAGGTVTISGDISQDVRAAGGQTTISGNIGNNLTLGGGTVEITDSAKIGGSLVAGAGNINIAAPIGKDVRLGGGNVTLSSNVGGNFDAGVGSLRLTSKASVDGDLTYWSSADASIDSAAIISGEVVKHFTDQVTPSPTKALGILAGINIFLTIISSISTLILGLLLIKLLPGYTQSVVNKLRKRPWASLGIGFLGVIVIPIVFVLLLITVVGIPLALILAGSYLITLFIVRIFAMRLIGQLIFERFNWKENDYTSFVLGLIIYYLIQLLPIIGGIWTAIILLATLGASLLTKKDFILKKKTN